MREDHGVDPLEVAGYFPLNRVLEGLFDITQKVLRPRPTSSSTTPAAWHADASLYEMQNPDTGDTVAYFYMDLFPREGKFTHAAAFPLVPAAKSTPTGTGSSRCPRSWPTSPNPTATGHRSSATRR